MTDVNNGHVLDIPEDYINPRNNRRLTEFQKRVYECVAQIPEGYYSTYAAIARVLNTSPRAVGTALCYNPFYPFPVPCHRVLTSTWFIGGRWSIGELIEEKHELLVNEGLPFESISSCLPEEYQEQRFFNNFRI